MKLASLKENEEINIFQFWAKEWTKYFESYLNKIKVSALVDSSLISNEQVSEITDETNA